MTEILATFSYPEIPTITNLEIGRTKTDSGMIYLDNNNIDESICQNLRKKNVYESDM